MGRLEGEGETPEEWTKRSPVQAVAPVAVYSPASGYTYVLGTLRHEDPVIFARMPIVAWQMPAVSPKPSGQPSPFTIRTKSCAFVVFHAGEEERREGWIW